MRLHSNTLTRQEITDTLRRTVPGAWIIDFSEHGSRSHKRAFEVKLRADKAPGRRRPNHGYDGEYAATYDEWGAFIAVLYRLDPDMRFGGYRDRDHFHRVTRGNYAGVGMVVAS